MSLTTTQDGDSGVATQDGRLLAIDTPLGADQVLLTGLRGEDEISRGFHFTLELASTIGDEKMQSLLGKAVTIWRGNNQDERRYPINGFIRRLICTGTSDREWDVYRAELVPHLWFLTRSSDCRIFQNLSVPEIIAKVFDEHDLHNYVFRGLNGTYPKLDYCVQYRETAFAFVSRLMEHVGLFYWHEHSAEKHVLVIADLNLVTPYNDPRVVSLSSRTDLGEIQSLEHDYQFRPGKWTLNDYDFESPTKMLRMETPTTLSVTKMAAHEIYDYPGGFTDPDTGKALTRVRIEMEEAQHHRVNGTGACTGFNAGQRFDVQATAPASASSYLLVLVRHEAEDHTHFAGAAPSRYSNSFVAMPARVAFRPELITPKPFVRGLQTATVVGPSGENIYCDPYGRVRVQFHWDRLGKRDNDSSCWIRVAQLRSGAHYGGMVIPHVGHEVVVSFLEGDPDRPLIVGAVPNAMTMPSIKLPDDKNKTVQRDHGNNKIVMQGKTGSEHLTMMSPRSLNMFAVKSPAKALSAMFVSRDASINDNIDDFEDPNSLAELHTIFKAMDDPTFPYTDTNTQGKVLSTTPSPSAQDPVPVGTDDVASQVDINSMSEGNINSLSLGNTNAWVYQKSNTWVNSDSNTKVNGNLSAEIEGTSMTTVHQTATANYLMDNVTNVSGTNYTFAPTNITDASTNTTNADTNVTMVSELNNQIVAGENNSLVVGASTSTILGGSLTFVGPLSIQIFDGFSSQVTVGISQQLAMMSIQHNLTSFSTNDVDLKIADLKSHSCLLYAIS